jgi:hypothetical protein
MASIDGIKLKTERAKKHIDDLNLALEVFYATKPYGIGKKIHTKTGEHSYHVTRITPVPVSLSLIIGDVLQNLRSALDHLAYALVAKAIAPDLPNKYLTFPIMDTAKQYMAPEGRGKIERAGNEAMKRIDALKPYKGGNDLLWQLSRLNILDKHRLLLTTTSRYKHRRVTLDDYARMALQNPKAFKSGIFSLVKWTNFGGPAEPLKVGDILYVKPAILNLKKEMEFTLEVAFNEPEILECKSVLETLYEMFKLVEGIIPRFADLL